MYAIVRNRDGTYYTSMVFGSFCRSTAADEINKYHDSIHDQFVLVLNEEKNRMVKRFIYPSEDKYLDPRVLIVDADRKDWILYEEDQGCVNFLSDTDFYADEIELEPSILSKCIAMDAMQTYPEVVEVITEADIENLCYVSGWFHDAYIKECVQDGDTLYVLFDGVWGCKIELWFDGDVGYCIESRYPEYIEPIWYDSTILKADGYFYLVDEGDMKVEDITDEYCWFRGRHLKYHVIPNA